MELPQLTIFLTVASEKSFSRAAQKLMRTQPAISLAVQRLEAELGEKLVDRSFKDGTLTDAGRIVYGYALQFENLRREMTNALTELRNKYTGKLIIGANESGALYLLTPIHKFRQLYPGVKVEVRRSLSRNIPNEVLDNSIDLGVVSYKPGDRNLQTVVIYNDAVAFIIYPEHPFAKRKQISIRDLGSETFIAHNIASPYRQIVLEAFQKHQVQLHMDIEMPTVETIKKMVQSKMGVAFVPRMCVQSELAAGQLVEVPVRELRVARKIHLVHPAHRHLSHAARAFLELVENSNAE
ncbi:MAG: LysR family transcriptional regulator [Acidobacteria bacterium RIFCSPLOWO2_12_FULL_59_11]|nr:MAG: LysR family transcriptional regulator [Acidobacteria bacterium RIFCSPLOWO2_12_FULL_59_11]